MRSAMQLMREMYQDKIMLSLTVVRRGLMLSLKKVRRKILLKLRMVGRMILSLKEVRER